MKKGRVEEIIQMVTDLESVKNIKDLALLLA
jgi:hypothetical protein